MEERDYPLIFLLVLNGDSSTIFKCLVFFEHLFVPSPVFQAGYASSVWWDDYISNSFHFSIYQMMK
jgi:hypothetical protein